MEDQSIFEEQLFPVTELDNYTDEKKEIIDRVYKKIQANIKRDKELYE